MTVSGSADNPFPLFFKKKNIFIFILHEAVNASTHVNRVNIRGLWIVQLAVILVGFCILFWPTIIDCRSLIAVMTILSARAMMAERRRVKING